MMASVANKRPDLFGAVIARVLVSDLLRYHLFTGGEHWIPDKGTSDDPSHMNTLLAYSPLHNVKKVKYPAYLVTTADKDDRVPPLHAYKLVASLQYMMKDVPDANPVLLRVASNQDHGNGGIGAGSRFNFL